jgi:hypothetical protein
MLSANVLNNMNAVTTPQAIFLQITAKKSQSSDFSSHFGSDSPWKIDYYNVCTSYAHKYASKLTKLICLHNFADNIKSNMA